MNTDTDRLILGEGEDCIFSSDPKVTGLNNNVLVIGTTGSGKTVSIVEAHFLETCKRNLVAAVTKRRLVHKYTPVMRERGYRVWDLNFVDPASGNVGFDPLKCVSGFSDITFLARSLVLANPGKENSTADSYWDDAAVSLLSAEIAYVLMKMDRPTFGDVLDFHNQLRITTEYNGIIQTNYDEKFECLEEMDPTCFAVTCWKSFQQLPARTAGCIFSNLNTTIDSVFTPEVREMFCREEMINFEQLAKEKTVLFITTSPVNSFLNSFISMFYGTMFKELFEYAESLPGGELPIPCDVLVDDFATGCPVNMFDRYISVFREKGMSTTILVQSESQLASLYGSEKAVTIINNCDTIVYLGSMDITTGKNISLRCNRLLEDILYMPLASEILLRRGQKPIFTRRYPIMENEMYQKITAAYDRHLAEDMVR